MVGIGWSEELDFTIEHQPEGWLSPEANAWLSARRHDGGKRVTSISGSVRALGRTADSVDPVGDEVATIQDQ